MRRRLQTVGRRGTTVALLVIAAVAAAAQEPMQALVINEVELNPEGFDSGKEWIEILNRSGQPVDLAGWTVTYGYRGPGALPVVGESKVLAPGERFVFVYPRLALRNAEPALIRLIDPSGSVADEVSSLIDTEDNDNTWQRYPDGGDPWFPDLFLFLPATRGRSND